MHGKRWISGCIGGSLWCIFAWFLYQHGAQNAVCMCSKFLCAWAWIRMWRDACAWVWLCGDRPARQHCCFDFDQNFWTAAATRMSQWSIVWTEIILQIYFQSNRWGIFSNIEPRRCGSGRDRSASARWNDPQKSRSQVAAKNLPCHRRASCPTPAPVCKEPRCAQFCWFVCVCYTSPMIYIEYSECELCTIVSYVNHSSKPDRCTKTKAHVRNSEKAKSRVRFGGWCVGIYHSIMICV